MQTKIRVKILQVSLFGTLKITIYNNNSLIQLNLHNTKEMEVLVYYEIHNN